MKRFADRHRRPAPHFTVGQKVWLSARDIHLLQTGAPVYPPFPDQPCPDSWPQLQSVSVLPPPLRRIHLHVTSRLHPPAKPPTSRLIHGSPVHTVCRLLKVRNREQGRQFLVQWGGCGPEENYWVPEHHIDPTLVKQFFIAHPDLHTTDVGCRLGVLWGLCFVYLFLICLFS